MTFFRNHFTTILMVCLGIVGLASVLPYIFSNNEQLPQQQVFTQEEIKPYEPPFEHEGNLSFFKNDGALITQIQIEFARTAKETEVGLMYRKSMEENQGMLFIFPNEEMRSFWMRNTYIPLDIIYLNKEKQIVSIVKNAEPLSETSRPSEAEAMYVLEVNGGFSDKYDLKKGDYITYESLID